MKIELKNELNLYPITSFDLPQGITFVAGCNGGGKSTLLREINDYLTTINFKHKYLDCNEEFHYCDIESIPKEYDLMSALQKGFCSEHEHYENMFYDWVSHIRPADNDTKFAILIDGLDSGSDVYFLNKHLKLFKIIYEDCIKRGVEIYIVVTCNNFKYLTSEMHNCLWVPTLETKKMPLYAPTEFEKYEKDIVAEARKLI